MSEEEEEPTPIELAIDNVADTIVLCTGQVTRLLMRIAEALDRLADDYDTKREFGLSSEPNDPPFRP